MNITILGLDSCKGKELVSLLCPKLVSVFNELGYGEPVIKVLYNGTQYDMIKACMGEDLVIFDGSVEVDALGSWDSNYAAATANPCSQDNILVVSRTRLPFNFLVLRTNVPEIGQEDKDENGKPILSFSNEDIVEWVVKEVILMSQPIQGFNESKYFPPRIPIPEKLKMNIPPFNQLATVINELSEVQEAKMIDSLDFMAATRKGGAFISYRSYYYNHPYHGKTVVDLKMLIKDRHQNREYPVTVYAKGDIASEFMTEQRRWFVESFVDRKLRTVEEVWIFETDASDGYGYYDSWWTQGEIISLMYMKANGMTLPSIYIYRYNETNMEMKVEEKTADFIPDLTEEALHLLSQYFANAEGANEGMKNMRELRNKNFVYKRLAYWAMKEMQKQFMPSNLMKKLMDHNTYEDFLSSIYAHVYDRSFTENRIVYAPQKVESHYIDDFKDPQFIKQFMLINSVRDDGKYKEDIESRGFYSISPNEMEQIIKKGVWKSPCNSKELKILKSSVPLFMWWPIRKGAFTGPNNVLIEIVDVWDCEEKVENKLEL